ATAATAVIAVTSTTETTTVIAVTPTTAATATATTVIAVTSTTVTTAATTIVTVAVTPATAATAAALACRRTTDVRLDVDELTGDTGVGQTVQDTLIHVLRQFDQGVVERDGDAAEVLVGQATLVGQGTDDGARAHVLTLADGQTVGGEV